MLHEQVTYSSIVTVLHKLNIQSISLIVQEWANLIDSLIKIMMLDSDDVTASKDHNPYKQIVFHIWNQKSIVWLYQKELHK